MRGALVTRKVLYDVLDELGQRCSGRVWLLGETSHVYEGWRSWTDAVHVWSEVRHRDEWLAALAICRRTHGVDIHDEFPGDVIPLPDGYEERAREAGRRGDLHVAHFDPYSVAFRHIARGEEPDYHTVMMYIERGWIDPNRMDALLQDLLPRFTMKTIQQDPAEFRRKYKGMTQMAARLTPGTVHRPF